METLTFIELAKILISFAVCAPSGHNSQPWKYQISENQIIIEPDFSKHLPVVDSTDRELFISLGCALENMQIAANHYGYSSDYTFDGEKIVVTFSGKGNCAEDTLFASIKNRHTYRGQFSGERISPEKLNFAENQEDVTTAIFHSESAEAQTLSRLIYEGNIIQMSDTAFKNELTQWMRFNKRHVAQTRNGLCYNVLGFPATPKIFGRRIIKMFLKPKSQNKTDMAVNSSASAYCLFSAKENTAANWIKVGKALERFLLNVTASGLAYSFSNQPCEVPELAEQLRSELSVNSYPSVLLRLGYGRKQAKHFAPREEPEVVIIEN
ncbi:MAG: nitroreductase [Bacteroidales bacterium]|nr:nitroreductase [Bacteroidales bacterium]